MNVMRSSETGNENLDNNHNSRQTEQKMYLQFGAMIATSMIIMYAVMYVNTYQLSHIYWSETRLFMTLLMGSAMTAVMLGFMRHMYKNMKLNLSIIAGSVLLFIMATFLVRSQDTVGDRSYMRSMIPHHSIAILTSENAELKDVRVCELAAEIIKAQKREIQEMQWLIKDISTNGPVQSRAQAENRKVPDFDGNSIRSCID